MCAVTARNRRLLCVLKIKGRKTTNGAPVAANTLLYGQKPAKRLYHDKYPKYHLEKARQKKTWPEPLPCAKKYLTLRKDNV